MRTDAEDKAKKRERAKRKAKAKDKARHQSKNKARQLESRSLKQGMDWEVGIPD